MDYEKNLIVKIAWLYYKEGMTQQEISESLHIPRQRVIKYLDTARMTNTVQIHIDAEAQMFNDLQNQLIHRYGLDDVYIVPTPEDCSEGRSVMDTVSMAAAQYVTHKFEFMSDITINVGAGRTIMKTLNHLIVPGGKTLSLISLTGGVSYYVHAQGSFNFVHTPQERVRSFIIPAPHCASTASAAQCFLNEPSVKSIMNMREYADMTLLGIGVATQEATMVREGLISESEIALIRMRHAVGDMLSQYYDINGDLVEFEGYDRFITTKLDALHSLKNVVGIAGGKERVLPIIGALNGGYLNTLITDADTARAVLESSKQDAEKPHTNP